jgi:hypothetical protein
MKRGKRLSCSTGICWVYSLPTQLEECSSFKVYNPGGRSPFYRYSDMKIKEALCKTQGKLQDHSPQATHSVLARVVISFSYQKKHTVLAQQVNAF